MSTIAEKIRNQRLVEFESEFDLNALMCFVEKQLSRFGYVEIGICHERLFEDDYLKRCYNQVMMSDCKWLSFADGYECYVWRTQCQIPQKFVQIVKSKLSEQGLSVFCKGAGGYDEYDVIVAKL